MKNINHKRGLKKKMRHWRDSQKNGNLFFKKKANRRTRFVIRRIFLNEANEKQELKGMFHT